MGRYLARRLLFAIGNLWGLATLSFFMLKALPGSPFDSEISLDPTIKAALHNYYGAGRSIVEDYGVYLQRLLHGDLGVSTYFPDQSVHSVLVRTLGVSLPFGLAAILLTVVGVLMASFLSARFVKFGRWMQMFAKKGLALPTLIFAPLVIYFFSYRFDFFPMRPESSVLFWVLPMLTVCFRPLCSHYLMFSSRLSEALRHPSIRTLRAFGVSENRLILRYGFKYASVFWIGQVPSLVAGFLSGSLLVETLFSLQGFGATFVNALLDRDWSLVIGMCLWTAGLTIFVQLLADLWIRRADPRIEAL